MKKKISSKNQSRREFIAKSGIAIAGLTIFRSFDPPSLRSSSALSKPTTDMFPNNIYPARAVLVTVENSGSLQKELDRHGAVRLLPGNYEAGSITLRRGQQIYGLPGTKLEKLIIEPGTTHALLSNVSATVVFPASDIITRNNIFLRTGNIKVQGGTLEDNIFVDAGTDIFLDVTTSGYLRNNRFVRSPGQMQGSAMLKFLANPERPSTGNVFLWMNACINDGPTTEIVGVPELTIALVDAELWSKKTKEHTPLFVTTGPMQRLNIFAVQGGRYDTNKKEYGLIDTAAREVRIFGLTPGYRGESPDTMPEKIVLREGNERSIFTDSLHYSMSLPATSTLHVRAFELPRGVPEVGLPPINGSVLNRSFTITPQGAERSELNALIAMICQTDRRMQPWARPVFEPVPDPAGKKWNKKLTAAPDHTSMIQARLDKEGIVLLAPGTYYLSAPLRLNPDKGLVGSGMEQTVIIAKDPTLSMFVYESKGNNNRTLFLSNLTLQGGGVGLHLKGENIKGFINKSVLSHLTFRNMSTAGIFVDLSTSTNQSMDNNLISACNFVQCGSGLKQHPGSGSWGFIDKLVMYRCQFIQCGIGLDLPANRSNNNCSYIECKFAENSIAVARLRHNTTPSFANCDFISNAGDPVVDSDTPVNFLSCHFMSGKTARSLLPSGSNAEGCKFSSEPNATTVIVGNPSRNQFYNCRIEMPLGTLKDALFLNNQVTGQSDLSQVASQIVDGKVSVLVPGATSPGPQLLVTGG